MQQQLDADQELIATLRRRIEEHSARSAAERERALEHERKLIALEQDLAAVRAERQELRADLEARATELAREQDRSRGMQDQFLVYREQAESDRLRIEELNCPPDDRPEDGYLTATETTVASLQTRTVYPEPIRAMTVPTVQRSDHDFDLENRNLILSAEHVIPRVPEVMGNLRRLGDIDRRRRLIITIAAVTLFGIIACGFAIGLWVYRDRWIPTAAPITKTGSSTGTGKKK